jgi:hypothetical protein
LSSDTLLSAISKKTPETLARSGQLLRGHVSKSVAVCHAKPEAKLLNIAGRLQLRELAGRRSGFAAPSALHFIAPASEPNELVRGF